MVAPLAESGVIASLLESGKVPQHCATLATLVFAVCKTSIMNSLSHVCNVIQCCSVAEHITHGFT